MSNEWADCNTSLSSPAERSCVPVVEAAGASGVRTDYTAGNCELRTANREPRTANCELPQLGQLPPSTLMHCWVM